jgi:CHAT domain-containing protein
LLEALLAPVLPHAGVRRLVIVPHRALHYVPFGALHDGKRHLIDSHEVCVTPSAGVLLHCLSQPAPAWKRAVLLGVPDALAPRVEDEVRSLAPLFALGEALLGPAATLEALRAHATQADVLHLACHGVFRPDSPFFSSLRLGDGWLTVRDAYTLHLRAGLVTLSACETGLSAVAPGDELIGLARGFLFAGTPSLLVSLWTVDDAATTHLMQRFYAALLAGKQPAAALREAQLSLRRDIPHPFFWAAFVTIGRW